MTLSSTLTDDLQWSEQAGHRLRRAHQRATAIFSETLDDPQITPTQWAILAVLERSGALSQNHLGRMASMDPATTQGVILRLLDRQLVERNPDPHDRRRASVRLTPAGKALVERLKPAVVAANERTLAPLTDEERRTFLTLLERIL
jgi:MarR family transcriptional regulator, lower aerobic nicotinate degradation pathway regulator